MRNLLLVLLTGCVWTPQRGCVSSSSGVSSVGVSDFVIGESGGRGETGVTECAVEVERTDPVDNSSVQFYQDPVVFHFNGGADKVLVESQISGTTSYANDGQILVFTPDAPLATSTPYLVGLFFCQSVYSLHFTTSNLGEPLLGSVEGRAWKLSFEEAQTTSLMGGVLKGKLLPLLLRVGEGGFRLASTRSDGRQDWCAPTSEGSMGEEAILSADLERVSLSTGTSFPLHAAHVDGAIAPDGQSAMMALSGVVNFREVDVKAMGLGTALELCGYAKNEGEPCVACDDGVKTCLPLRFGHLVGVPWDDTVLPVEGENCDGCQDGPPAEGAVCAG